MKDGVLEPRFSLVQKPVAAHELLSAVRHALGTTPSDPAAAHVAR